MNFLKKFFENHSLKVISFILAIAVWIVVYNDVNPLARGSLQISLEIINEDYISNREFVLANKDEIINKKITIYLRTNEKEIEQLKAKKADIKAIVDLKTVLIPSDGSMPKDDAVALIEYTLPDGFNKNIITAISDNYVNVTFDNLSTKEFPIIIETKGDVAEGYKRLNPKSRPDKMSISGARSSINKIDRVVVSVEYTSEINSENVQYVEAILYDKDGVDITSAFELQNKNIRVETTVQKKGQVQINTPVHDAVIPDGYQITDVSWEPKHIEIVGPELEIDNFKDITLDTINLANFEIDENRKIYEQSFELSNILAEHNVKPDVDEDGVTNIKVIFTIEKIETKTIQIPVSQISFGNHDLTYEINTEFVELTISGTKTNVENIKPEQINGEIETDITSLAPGVHVLVPRINLPDEFEVVAPPSGINITIYVVDALDVEAEEIS